MQKNRKSQDNYRAPSHHPAPSKKKPPLQFMRGPAKAFWKDNPILAPGQPAVELDMHRIKVGDGVTKWRQLPYISKGSDGKPGKSAYQIWKEIGNRGTVDDFFESLIGPEGKSAYQIWLSVGNEGSVFDFIASLQGDKGDKGDSVYDLWIKAGNSGTIYDFLTAMKGPKGDTGKSAYEAYVEGGGTLSEEQFNLWLQNPIQWGYF